MNTFSWLVIGHLVGDWLLQNDWMARGKRQGFFTLAGLTHYVIYTIITAGALWFSHLALLDLKTYLLSIAIIFVSHWLIDATNVVTYWMRIYGHTPRESVRITIDQTLHFLILAWLATF